MSAGLYPVSIESQNFPGSFLRMDGSGVTTYSLDGGGTVNAQNYDGPWEKFIIEHEPNTDTFSIRSQQFENIYLRLDGRDVTPNHDYPFGAGTVNCQ